VRTLAGNTDGAAAMAAGFAAAASEVMAGAALQQQSAGSPTSTGPPNLSGGAGASKRDVDMPTTLASMLYVFGL
jgi:hypothetical protein